MCLRDADFVIHTQAGLDGPVGHILPAGRLLKTTDRDSLNNSLNNAVVSNLGGGGLLTGADLLQCDPSGAERKINVYY